MNIAIDVRSLMEGRHSGVEEYTEKLIYGMIRVAPQHRYHLFYNSARPVSLPDFGRGRVIIHGSRYPNKLLNISQFLVGYPHWDTLIGQPIDVVLVPSARLTPLIHSTSLVVVAHDVSYEKFPEFLDPRRRIWHRFMRPKLLMQRADRIIAVSEHTKHDVATIYDIPHEKIEVIHSGIHAVQRPRSQDIVSTRNHYGLQKEFILYLGAREPRKNIPSIIRAFSAIASDVPHDLVIAGDKGWREGEINQAVAETPFRNRIHQIGFIPDLYKPALYAAADLFVYPSFYEGFGFPPLEALVSGTPVITSFNSALPEIVGTWATLIDPYNMSELAAVMKEHLQVPGRVPDTVRIEILDRYSWDAAARATVKVLESVA